MNRNPFYFDERAEKSLFLSPHEQDRQLSEKLGLLTSHKSVDSFDMPHNSSSRDPLAASSRRGESRRTSNAGGGGRFHFLRQWFVGGGVEMQQHHEGSISPYEEEEVVECTKDIELRRLDQQQLQTGDEFVDDGVDLGMDFEEEINDLVAAYPHYSEALEAAVELQSLRRRELEFGGSDTSSLQRRKGKGSSKGRKGHQQSSADGGGVGGQRSSCQCCACFRAPSEEYGSEEAAENEDRPMDHGVEDEDDDECSEGNSARHSRR